MLIKSSGIQVYALTHLTSIPGKGDQKEQKTTDERSSGKNNGAANPDNVQLQHNKLPKSDL